MFVHLRYNQLSAVPASLANCTKIDEFNIEGNNVAELPVSKVLLSFYFCMDYFMRTHLNRYFVKEASTTHDESNFPGKCKT